MIAAMAGTKKAWVDHTKDIVEAHISVDEPSLAQVIHNVAEVFPKTM